MQYRRLRFKGGIYFFTVVTYERMPILTIPENLQLLKQAFERVRQSRPFKLIAIVVLPDHMHSLWSLPEEDDDFSTRWRLIKTYFSKSYMGSCTSDITLSRRSKNEKTIWQRRFWEHLIRDNDDLAQHLDYIHLNPVKHGFVTSPEDWPYSSFRWFMQKGYYSEDFGKTGIDFGENIGDE